jgi:hypothetical protein
MCALWLVLAFFYLLFQNGIVAQNNSQEIRRQQEYAAAALAASVLNVTALTVFMNKSRGSGLGLLALVQAADLAATLVVGTHVAPTSDIQIYRAGSTLAALTLVLALVLWRSTRGS